METRYRVSLGGVQMDSLDDAIVIMDISYAPIQRTDITAETAYMDGFEWTKYRFNGQTVTVTFMLRIYDVKARNAAVQRINAWANTRAHMTVSDREKQYLPMVMCTQYASVKSARNWTDPLTVVFASERVPFWLSSDESAATVIGKNVRGTLKVDGMAGLVSTVSVEITAQATVKTLQLTVGDTRLILRGLNVPSGKTVLIDYINNRYLRIRANGASALACLDPESADRLEAPCAASTAVAVIADGSVRAVFKARGCWI